MAEPTGLVAKSGIELWTAGTPNGHKVSVLLEELKEAYGMDYSVQSIDIFDNDKKTQKPPWYTALNPNGRIPTIVDHDRGGFAVFETAAILTYLARHYDPEHKFSFPVDSDDYSPIQRYVGETERLYGVLDARLANRDYVAGAGRGRYSIADMNLVGLANASRFSGIELKRQFPNVQAWLEKLLARPAVRRGLAVPDGPLRFSNEVLERALNGEDREDREGLRRMVEEGDRLVREAKKRFGYVYASP
ncbi:hypothetical protein C8A03DRAFT_44251 [Achaetomium macrosporum]|uniref:Glutathione S-transferase n=1 Tax=Achaetomium macrosporum TaxID=79813 RepID=A0AAN7C9M1_9PEZI|nr:hypothetical protein C8A03DRAFT_44251 [Achaetomium macrosporum]